MTVSALPIRDRTRAKSWMRHGVVLAALLLLILLSFHDAVVNAVQVWIVSPTYSHCFLIIPIVAWLIWDKRALLADVVPRAAPATLWLLLPLLLLWWAGRLSTINEVQQYAVILMAQTVIVAVLGTAILRLLWFPILYLIFLVPTGEYLITPMQHFTAQFVDVCLNFIGIPHYFEGTTFELTNGRFEIAEACAGLRFLIATVTLGVLFSNMMFQKWYKSAIFLVASVAVPLIGNGLRCVGIILLAHFTNNKYGAGADHIVYGWGFNVAILLLLIFIGYLLRDETPARQPVPKSSAKEEASFALPLTAAVVALVLCAGPALASWRDSQTAIDPHLWARPLPLSGWREAPNAGNWHPDFPEADAHKLVSLTHDAAPPVDLYIGYYVRSRNGHTLTAHVNTLWDDHWTPVATSLVTVPIDGAPVQLQEWTLSSGYEKRLVWSTYRVDRRLTNSGLAIKLLQLRAPLDGDESQAVLALSTPIDGTGPQARARLLQGLQALGSLSALIDGLGGHAHTAGGL